MSSKMNAKRRCQSKPTLQPQNLNSLPLKSLKNVYTDLKIQPNRELSYKKSTSKSNKGSAASIDSRKQTINLMIKNNPNTGLAVLLREVSPPGQGIIESSPSIFPKTRGHHQQQMIPHSGSNPSIMQSQYRRDNSANAAMQPPMSYQDSALTSLSQNGAHPPQHAITSIDYQTTQFQSPNTSSAMQNYTSLRPFHTTVH